MEVVLNSHIALLVLGYLYEQKLDHVSKYFCKYSPHLEEEYRIIKKGLRPVIINSDNLSAIVKEHCYIKSKVNEIIATFPSHINVAFERQTLSGKVNHLLKMIKKATDTSEEENILKRTRSEAGLSSNETSTNTTQIEDLPGYYQAKKRRMADSYMIVRNEYSEDSESEENSTDNEANVQSVFTEKILEDKNFQSRLLENINTVLKNGTNDKRKNQSQSATSSLQFNNDDHLDQMIQDIISVTEKDPSFDEFVHDVVVNNCNENIKKLPSKIQRNTNKGIQTVPVDKNELAVEEIKSNLLRLEKLPEPNAVNRHSSSEIISNVEKNSSASKFLVMNSTDFVSANIQSLSSFTTDHLFLDLNGAQQFPILTGNDGAMYINSNSVQYDTRQPSSFVIVNPTQKNYENSQLIFSTPNFEEFDSVSNGRVVEGIKENSTVNHASSSKDIVVMDNNNCLKDISSSDCKLLKEKKTPECNINSLNISISKSLSTPRRKSSHVRVLNFSPLKIINKKSELQNLLNEDRHSEKNDEKSDKVESLQSNIVSLSSHMAENESSNSTDLTNDPSNVTVIQCQIPLNDDTPKRKTSVKTCKRNISRSNSEETTGKNIKKSKVEIKKESTEKVNDLKNTVEIKEFEKCVTTRKTRQTKKKQSSLQKKDLVFTTSLDPAEEWKQMRERSKNPNFDQFLREAHSKTPLADAHIHKRRKLRRKIGLKLKKNEVQSSIDNKRTSELSENINSLQNSNENMLENNASKKIGNVVKKGVHEKKSKNIEPKTNFLNFRIKTPIKDTSNDLSKKTIAKSKINKKNNGKKEVHNFGAQEICVKASPGSSDRTDKFLGFNKNECEMQKSNDGKKNCENEKKIEISEKTDNVQNLNKEKEKRTANIAHILDTPFKSDENNFIPPTPGIMLSSNLALNNTLTPITNLPFSSFSNLKCTEIKTPAFAITPGGRLCYSTDKETPRSGVVTDYSSGGSYYKPDDSADLIKKLDRELNEKLDQRQIRLEKHGKVFDKECRKGNNDLQMLKELPQIATNQNKSCDLVMSEIIPAPVVLNKVQSFCEESSNIPHNKFEEAGLPDITDESTSSSSSEESCSKLSLNEKISAAPFSNPELSESITIPTTSQQNKQALSLLSNIDSSEDDNWEIQSISRNKTSPGGNGPRDSNNCKVKLSVRRRIAPKNIKTNDNENDVISKHGISIKRSDKNLRDKNVLSTKLRNVRVKLNKNLRPEIKEKRSNDESKSGTNINNKKQSAKTDCYELSPEKNALNENKLNVLAALNLSAKKKCTIANDSQVDHGNKKPDIKNISTVTDDNDVSEFYTLRMEEESISNDSSEVRNAALTLTNMKTKKIETELRAQKSVSLEKKNDLPQKSRNSTKSLNLQNDIEKSEITQASHKNCGFKNLNSSKKEVEMKTIPYDSALQTCEQSKLKYSKELQCTTPTNSQNLNNEIVLYPSKNTTSVHESKLNNNSEKVIDSDIGTQVNKPNISNEQDTINEKSISKPLSELGIINLNAHDSGSESDDSYDECEPIFSKKCDEFVRYIHFDEESTNSSFNVPQQLDLSKSAIKITINNNVRRITCTEEFNLFHLDPNNENNTNSKQNYSKKITKSSKLRKEQDSKIQLNLEDQEKILNQSKESTPFLGKIKITHRNKFSNVEVSRKKPSLIEKERSSETKNSSISDYDTDVTKANQESLSKKNIRSEDINAVLSHLYGNVK